MRHLNMPKNYDLAMPHERDEMLETPDSPGPGGYPGNVSRPLIAQAESDVRCGLRDTDRRGIPSDVPGPGADPEHSPGAKIVAADDRRVRQLAHR